MAKASFADMNQKMTEAFAFLRSFTLGQRGFTQRDGVAGIKRVSELCDQMKERFATGPHATEAAAIVVEGRTRILAANARLAILLRKK
jgi:hypothetical protein